MNTCDELKHTPMKEIHAIKTGIPSQMTGGVIVENKEVTCMKHVHQNITGVDTALEIISNSKDKCSSSSIPEVISVLQRCLSGVEIFGSNDSAFGLMETKCDLNKDLSSGPYQYLSKEPKICVNLKLLGSQLVSKSYVANFTSFSEITGDINKTIENLKMLQASSLCNGMKEEQILPMLTSFESSKLMTALFLIERRSYGFVYKSRQCRSIADNGQNTCDVCLEFFDNLLFVNSRFSDNELCDSKSDINVEGDIEPVQACFDDSGDEKSVLNEEVKSRQYLNHVGKVHDTSVRTDSIKLITKKEKSFECEDALCQRSFTSAVRLKNHIIKCHRISKCSDDLPTSKSTQNVQCPFCKEEFKVPFGKIGSHRLRQHLKSVHIKLELQEAFQRIIMEEVAESVICQLCGKSYTNQATLDSHVKLMHSEITEMESCHICGKSFKKGGSTLWGHIRTHEDGGHICSICGAKFKVKSYLQRHMKSHDPDCKKYECDICGDKFTRPYLMKQHQEFTHKKNLPFKCKECGKCLRSNTFLKIHMRSVHSKEKPFPCEICGFRSSRVDNLNIHRTKVHHINVKITRSQLQQLVVEGKHPFCSNPEDIPAF